jgi:hypothetical protein
VEINGFGESIIPQEGFLLLQMNFVDILIFTLSVIVLVYFIFHRVKYSNREVYFKKLEKLDEIKKAVAVIEKENEETEKIIKSINADTVYGNKMTDKLINYRDNEDKLEDLKIKQRKIELYLRYASKYINSFGV